MIFDRSLSLVGLSINYMGKLADPDPGVLVHGKISTRCLTFSRMTSLEADVLGGRQRMTNTIAPMMLLQSCFVFHLPLFEFIFYSKTARNYRTISNYTVSRFPSKLAESRGSR